jgi:NTE family protein
LYHVRWTAKRARRTIDALRRASEGSSVAEITVPAQADAVFEGGGVKGIAFAGAVKAAEDVGVRVWKNVAGTSAGAIVACLLVVGYDSAGLRRILDEAEYRRFADYGRGGIARGFLRSLRERGLAPGKYFTDWLSGHLAASPLAKERGVEELSFRDVVRDDLPPDLTEAQLRRARYRLRVIGSDVSTGRMLVLPDDVAGFRRSRGGEPLQADAVRLVDGVRISMSFPYLYTPVTLYGPNDRPHYIVDGGLLSNFPVWLFDSGGDRPPARPTWGFRLHGGTAAEESLPYHPVPMPFWRLKLARAMFQSATEAWDRDQLERSTAARTVSIPTGRVGTTQFSLSKDEAEQLYRSGLERTGAFFRSDETRAYLERFAERAAGKAEPTVPVG